MKDTRLGAAVDTPSTPGSAPGEPARATSSGAIRSGRGAGLRLAPLLAGLLLIALALWLTPLGALASRERALVLLAAIRRWPTPGLAPLVFIGLYTLATALALPGSALTVAGGALYGLWPGVLLNWTGAMLGASLGFLLARRLGRDFVARRLKGRAAALDEAAGRHGFRAILFLCLIPLVPFGALIYGAGLSAVRPRHFLAATALGIVPVCFGYTYFAEAILAGSLEARRSAYLHVLLAGALLAVLSLLPVLWRRLHRPAPPPPSAC